MFHVDFLALHFDHPGMFEHAPGGRAAGRFFFEAAGGERGGGGLDKGKKGNRKVGEERGRRGERKGKGNIPTLDEIFEAFAPFDAVLGFVLEFGDWLPDDVREEIDQAGAGLYLGAVGGEGKPVLGDFEEGDAQRPDVGSDGVGLAGDAFRRHVVGGADKGVGVAAGAERPADAKIAQFHLTVAAKEDVGGLDIYGMVRNRKGHGSAILTSVNDLLAVQVGQSVQHPLCNLSQHFFSCPTAKLLDLSVDPVEAAPITDLHNYRDRSGRIIRE